MSSLKNMGLFLSKPKKYFGQNLQLNIWIGISLVVFCTFLSILILPQDYNDLEMTETLSGVLVVIQGVMLNIVMFSSVLLMAIVIWIVVRLYKSQENFADIFGYSVWIYLPIILGIVWTALISKTGLPGVLELNVKVLMDIFSKPILSDLGSRISLFSLWSSIILYYYFHKKVEVKQGWAIGYTILLWLILNIPPVLLFA